MIAESEGTSTTGIYLIEDDRASTESICSVVSSIGAPINSYRTGEDFLRSIHDDAVGCVIVDYRLPGMTGLEVQSRLSDLQSLLSIILISGYADVPLAVKAMQQGAITLLQKPYEQEELLRAVEQALQVSGQRLQHRHDVEDARKRLSRLDEKEKRVLQFMLDGKPNKVVAYALGIGLRTVERRRHNIFTKTSVESEVQLATLVKLAEEPA